MIRSVWEYFFGDAVIELYKFTCGEEIFCYAAADVSENYQHEGLVYEPMYISRTNLKYSEDFVKDVLSVTMFAATPFTDKWKDGRPEFPTTLTVYRGSFRTRNYTPVWQGLVRGASYNYSGTDYSCELSCETPVVLMERAGLTRRYQVTCPHKLFSPLCGASQAANSFSVLLGNNINGYTIEVPSMPADASHFIGGQMVKADGSRRFITSAEGNTITLERSFAVTSGDVVTIIKGCNKSFETCIGIFGNHLNYGGFPWLPSNDPFTSTVG